MVNSSSSTPSFECHCDSLFSSSASGAQCTMGVGLILMIVAACVAAIAVPLVLLFRRHNRKVKSELNEKLLELDSMNQRIEHFKDVFTIKYDELTIISDIGFGAYGRVQKAKLNGELVAVKFLHEGNSSDPTRAYSKASFQRELKELRLSRHRNILALLGAGEDDQRGLYVVTEFCGRGSLYEVLQNESIEIPSSSALSFALQCAEGMRFLHEHNRIHRDLKSLNILVTEDWEMKIADFGAAKSIAKEMHDDGAVRANTLSTAPQAGWSDQQFATLFDGAIGTVQWIPPEAHLSSTQLTYRGDVYSFGIVMWEIVSRQTPYDGEELGPNGRFLRKKIQAGLRPALSKILPDLMNEDYIELMQRCWHASPAMRPLFPDVCTALAAMMPRLQTQMTSYPSMDSLSKLIPRHRARSVALFDTPYENVSLSDVTEDTV